VFAQEVRRQGRLRHQEERLKQRGKVKWFSDARGYGFISREGKGDVFVHYSAIIGQGHRTLEEGQEVEFEVEQGPKGAQAVKVVKV